ncbi:hypothetical protein [Luteimonas aquatica]|uniref:hypothetical protein n=1 Tax=Luteimonas aquatica TaxID=450364 RepID=UPI001F56B83B|nr:hypothetical protein [Luteimonas aquatica]
MIRSALALLILALSACASTGQAQRAAAPAPAGNHDSHPAQAHDPRLHAAPPQAAPIASPVVVPLDAATLASLPREAVNASAHRQALRCEGIALSTLLRATGAMPVEPLRGPQLARYVQADGNDGYRALYALAELDPSLGDRKVFVVDRCDGAPLGAEDGPLRLIAPQDARPARWVRQLKSLTVIVAP